jgi:maleylpyruvate isomerase
VTGPSPAVGDDLRRVAIAQQRFSTAIRGLGDAEVRRPTALPGWTVAHVLTHVARNADSHRRRAEAAVAGRVVDQYAGGASGRAAEIDAGAGRRAEELVDDVVGSAAAMQAAWPASTSPAWAGRSRDVSGAERRLDELPARRWQELEVHLVDLDVGVTHRHWPDDFVAFWLPRLRRGLPGRLPEGAEGPAAGAVDGRDELAWLYGRLTRPDLPALGPWQ